VCEQLRLRGKELLQLGYGPEMVFAIQAFTRMLLPQECQGANALHHVVLPAVCGPFVVNGE
jgi:hypothetical protein